MSAVLKKSTPGKFAYICHFQQIGINATKIEKTGIHFKTDVFAAVAIVDAKAPKYDETRDTTTRRHGTDATKATDNYSKNNFRTEEVQEVFARRRNLSIDFVPDLTPNSGGWRQPCLGGGWRAAPLARLVQSMKSKIVDNYRKID